MRREIVAGALLAVGLVSSCNTAPEAIPSMNTVALPPSSESSYSVIPEGLPTKVFDAAQAIVSIESREDITVILDDQGRIQQTNKSGYPWYGSGVHIGSGDILTANHIGNPNNDPEQPYGCLGQEIHGYTKDGETPFRASAESSTHTPTGLGDLALVNAPTVSSQTPSIDIAKHTPANTQEVYMINYQATGDNEGVKSDQTRSPASEQEALRKPAIFSGRATLLPDGNWIVVTGSDITKEFGSGKPGRLYPEGSGGALLNSNGELIGITTAVIDTRLYNPPEIKQVFNATLEELNSAGRYAVQFAEGISKLDTQILQAAKEPCRPDSSDRIITK